MLELAAVVAVLGVLAAMAITRFGSDAIAVTGGEGFARKVSIGLRLARRQAIAEGENAALTFARTGGIVTSWTVVRAPTSGDEVTELTTDVPTDVVVTTSNDRWEFDYTGVLVTPAAGGTIRVDAPGWYWNIQVYAATGLIEVTKVANP